MLAEAEKAESRRRVAEAQKTGRGEEGIGHDCEQPWHDMTHKSQRSTKSRLGGDEVTLNNLDNLFCLRQHAN